MAPEQDESALAKQTQSGAILGTPAYMAPEQARGHVRAIGPSTDIFALGTILYEMLAGHAPFRAATMLGILKQVCEQDPVSLQACRQGVPRDLETICLTCLQKEPAKRYVSALALADDLQRFLNGDSVLKVPSVNVKSVGQAGPQTQGVDGRIGRRVGCLAIGNAGLGFLRSAGRAQRRRGPSKTNMSQIFKLIRAPVSPLRPQHLSNYDVAGAATQLREAPGALRNWEWNYLQSRLDDSSLVRTVSPGSTAHLLYFDKAIRFGALTSDELTVVNEEGARRVHLRTGPSHRFQSVGETPAGLWILESGPADQHRLLDETGTVLANLEGWRSVPSRVLAVSPDRSRLAIAWALGPKDYEYDIVEMASGKKLATLARRADPPASLAFSPDGRRLVAAFEMGTIAQVWDAAGAPIAQLGGPERSYFQSDRRTVQP